MTYLPPVLSGYHYIGATDTVRAYQQSTVQAYGRSTIQAYEQSAVRAYQQSTVQAYGRSTIQAYGRSTVRAYEQSTVRAYEQSTVQAYEQSAVQAYGRSTVRAYEQSTVQAYGRSTVQAYGRSTVRAYEQSTVQAYEQSAVRAAGRSTVQALSPFVTVYKSGPEVTVEGDCIVIEIPQDWDTLTWLGYYGITPDDDGYVTLYKGVNDLFRSDHGADYTPGTSPSAPDWSPANVCGQGLHFSPHAFLTHRYTDSRRYVACRIKVEDIVVISDHYGNAPDKCKAPTCECLYECDDVGDPIGRP